MKNYLFINLETVGLYNKLEISENELKKLGYFNKEEVKLICELSYSLLNKDLKLLQYDTTLAKPDIDPNPFTMEVNDITAETLKNKKKLQDTDTFKNLKKIVFENDLILVGHNIDFVISMLKAEGLDLSSLVKIDTLQLSKKYYPNIEAHRLKFLFYKYNLYKKYNDDNIIDFKSEVSSLKNTINTYKLLRFIVEDNKIDLNDLAKITSSKIKLEYMPFGKMKGTSINDLEDSFILFFVKNKIDDKNLEFTFNLEVDKRGGIEKMLNGLAFYQLERMLDNEKSETEVHSTNEIYKLKLEEIYNKKKEEQLIFKFGKYIGRSFREILIEDPNYIAFLSTNDKLNKFMKEVFEFENEKKQ